MKYIFILATMLMVMSACTTQYQAGNYDDVYYSSKNQPPAPKHPMVVKTPESDINSYTRDESQQPQQEQQAPAEVFDNPDTTYFAEDQQYATDNNVEPDYGYNNDDYYDYAYSARLRRFHNPYCYDYYNDYYTNSYWYDSNPWNWGTSIYMGYNWWGPSFSFGYNPWYTSYYGGWGYGGYYGYGYDYGYGYGSYWNGYNHGYWDGYYDGHYYNSYDGNSFYYGHRGSVGSSGSITRNDNKTFGEKYEARYGRTSSAINDTRAGGTVIPERRSTSANETRSGTSIDDSRVGLTRGSAITQDARAGSGRTYATPTARTQNIGSNTNINPAARPGTETQRQGATIQRPENTTQRPVNRSATQPQRQYQYSSPNRNNQNPNSNSRGNVNSGRNTQSYTSPEYNRPRSGQEYTSPKYRSTQPSGNEQNNTRISPPAKSTSPARSGNNTYRQTENNRPAPRSNESYQAPRNNTNSQPARSNTYSAPPRSSSPAPARSSESYSPPRSSSSGSSGSSTPSRSSSSGSSGSSSSGSNNNSSSGSGHRR